MMDLYAALDEGEIYIGGRHFYRAALNGVNTSCQQIIVTKSVAGIQR